MTKRITAIELIGLIQQANVRLMCREKDAAKSASFLPSYKLPKFTYDSEKVRDAWARVLSASS